MKINKFQISEARRFLDQSKVMFKDLQDFNEKIDQTPDLCNNYDLMCKHLKEFDTHLNHLNMYKRNIESWIVEALPCIIN